MKKPFMLMILDGFGLSSKTTGNAIAAASLPNINEMFKKYPFTTLKASGLAVGLPEGQMGNSEVGHLNIGAGRVVYQELTRISKAIDEGIFNGNTAAKLLAVVCFKVFFCSNVSLHDRRIQAGSNAVLWSVPRFCRRSGRRQPPCRLGRRQPAG